MNRMTDFLIWVLLVLAVILTAYNIYITYAPISQATPQQEHGMSNISYGNITCKPHQHIINGICWDIVDQLAYLSDDAKSIHVTRAPRNLWLYPQRGRCPRNYQLVYTVKGRTLTETCQPLNPTEEQ